MGNLFQSGQFKLNSGKVSNFKIECDALTQEDIDTFALLISQKYKFKEVVGVPTGGIRIEDALKKYCINDESLPLLIVDDVLTTGGSMERYKNANEDLGYDNIIGVVLFARNECPQWIDCIFKML